jgi:hypothetical protein
MFQRSSTAPQSHSIPSVVQFDGAHLTSSTGGGSVSSHHPDFHALHYPASKRKAADGPNDPATVTAKAAAAALKQRQKATSTSTTATTVIPAQLPATSIPEVSQPSKLKATAPLVCWTVSGKAKYPQGIGQMIYSATKDPLISLPIIQEHHICFPYIIDASGIGCGCDGTI